MQNNKFLWLVANDLITKHRDGFSQYVLVFPGKRASLYFKKYLSGLISAPVMLPKFITINELFKEITGLAEPSHCI
ncbi:MAG: hypothetical protein HC896_10370 [Bacteroidales bacterium]|nr:hypothetical protein [Bacteroidales bacterium]